MADSALLIEQALGNDFDPKGDYIACKPTDVGYCERRGYAQVGEFNDGGAHYLIFDRRKQPKKKSARSAQFGKKKKRSRK